MTQKNSREAVEFLRKTLRTALDESLEAIERDLIEYEKWKKAIDKAYEKPHVIIEEDL